MADLFKEIIPSILQTGVSAMLTDQDERSYPHFIVNKALSNYPDTVLLANEINQYPSLDNKMKYHFLLNSVKKYKRPFVRWNKKVENDDLVVVKEYYGYSDAKAYEALSILSEDQIESLRRKTDKGG